MEFIENKNSKSNTFDNMKGKQCLYDFLLRVGNVKCFILVWFYRSDESVKDDERKKEKLDRNRV